MTYLVRLFDRDAGTLVAQGARLTFTYGAAALTDPTLPPLSVRLPKRPEPYADSDTRAFFENLLPEEEYRRLIAAGVRVSERNTAGLLGAIGGECAGAVSVWAAEATPPATPHYRDLSHEDLQGLFAAPGDEALIQAQREGRLSLAGAQAKLTLRRTSAGWQLPLDGAPATHILKRTRVPVPYLVENELLCMRLAGAVGLPAPRVELLDLGIPVLVVERFDRVPRPDRVARLHQEDLCQATGTPPQSKYEAEGGPSLAACADVLRRHSALPIADLRTLLRWVAFNYLIGNEDAHGKNLALLYTAEGLRLAPFYDLVSSTVYKGFSRNAAMGIGGERRYAYVGRRHWERFAEAVRVRTAVMRSALEETSEALEAVLDDTTGQVTVDAGDVPLLPTIQAGIRERIERLAYAWL